jgi:hypothetical protein
MKMPVFGHFRRTYVYWLIAAVSKLQTPASAGEVAKRDH